MEPNNVCKILIEWKHFGFRYLLSDSLYDYYFTYWCKWRNNIKSKKVTLCYLYKDSS